MKYIGFLISSLITISLTLILNGNYKFANLPPLAKFLHPVEGVWANGVSAASVDGVNKLEIPIKANAFIKFDDRLVPHIYADSLVDLLFLQGYIEASQRLFQLDLITRAAAGRLSEIFGERTLEADINQNRKYMEKAAENAVLSWQKHPEKYALFENYINGINAYIDQLSYKDYPIEFKLLNYHPEKWSYYKSALVSKYMAHTLSRREDDIELLNMKILLGDDLFNELFEEGEDGGFPVIPIEKSYDFDSIYGNPNKNIVLADQIFKKRYYEKQPKGIGSNNWVVGSSKSKKGFPIFCNDPHLSLSLPSIWYESHLMTPEFNCYGVSIPGIAGILMGFNDHIAWGETNVGHDVADMYLIKYVDDKKRQYYIDDQIHDIQFDIQEIKVKGKPSYFDTLRYTKWGLIVHESNSGKQDVAMQWLAAEPTDKSDINTFIELMACKNYQEFELTSQSFTTPAQNFLFAAKDGDIALRVNGILPAKHNEEGRFIKQGNVSSNGWSDFIPRSQNPQILNPKDNYLTSSNQRSASNAYPYYYNGTFEHYRNKVINRYLQKDTTFSVEDMMVMQGDSYSVLAEELLPKLLESISEDNEVIGTLKNWNYTYDSNKKAPIYFNLWLDHLRTELFDELYAYQDSMNITIPEDWKIVDLISNNCDHFIFDKLYTNEQENCDSIIQYAYKKMLNETQSMGDSVNWGIFKPITINHYARIPAFSRSGIKSSGWLDAINATNKTFGPSWRMAIQLGDNIEAYGIYPGGQSGNPASPFYDNAIKDWSNLTHYKLNFMDKSMLDKFEGIIHIKCKNDE